MPRLTLIDVLDRVAPDMEDAFFDAFLDLKSEVDLDRLERALTSGDIDQALSVLGIDEQFLEPMREALRGAYIEGGRFTISDIDGLPELEGGNRVRFRVSSPVADTILRGISGSVTGLLTAEALATARGFIVDALERRINPKQAALDLVGRYDKQAKRRIGGIIGLTDRDIQFQRNALDELLSGDPSRLSNYLTRKTRDRRFDGIVREARKAKKPVNAAQARKMISRMQDRLLKVRADGIAQHEMLQALHAGQEASLKQVVDQGVVPADAITGIWDATGDGLTRRTHNAADGQERKLGQPFNVGNSRLMYPHDVSLNPELKEVMRCRCHRRIKIDFSRVN